MDGTKHSIAVALAMAQIDYAINKRGWTYRESFDFDEFHELVDTIKGKKLTDDFDGKHFDLHQTNAFWIGLYDKKGRIISIQAAKLEDLGETTLGDHWSKQQRRKTRNQVGQDEFKLGTNHCPTSFMIKGRIVYHGEFWMHPKHRGDGFPEMLVHFGFFNALLRWNFDWVYGLMPTPGLHVGFDNRAGYQLAEPHALDWDKIPPLSFVGADDWLVAAPRYYVEYSARIISKLGLEGSPYMRKKLGPSS